MRPSWIFGCIVLTLSLIGVGGLQARFSETSPFNSVSAPSSPDPEKAQGASSIQTSLGEYPVFRVPIVKRSSEIPIVNVGFNGDQNTVYPMLLDTGASLSVITEPMATSLGFERTSEVTATTATGQRVRVPVGRVKSIQIGGTQFNDFEVAVGSVPLLGQNFLGRFIVVIGRDEVLLQPHPETTNSTAPTVKPSVPNLTTASPTPQVPVTSVSPLIGEKTDEQSSEDSYLDNLP